jgi:3-methyladenine DNA glycosylase AlkD
MTSGSVSLSFLRRRLRRFAQPARAKLVAGYFKTGVGEYGEGDKFLGATMPQIRSVVREGQTLSLADAARLLDSPWHEERMLAILILVRRFERGTPAERDRIFDLYMRRRRRINNWDLVDVSAGQILGPYLDAAKGERVRALLRSRNVWDRRMAMIATSCAIRAGRYAPTFEAAEVLMADSHDLIHKACGWMLREVGKRDLAAALRFLDRHAAVMPRTMLRYAIERLSERQRRHYMSLKAARTTRGAKFRALGRAEARS